MPTKERWSKMSDEKKAEYAEKHKAWVSANRQKVRDSVNKSYLKKVGGALSRMSTLADEQEKRQHRTERKKETNTAWALSNPEKIAAYRIKQKINGAEAARAAKRRAAKIKATPQWADLDEIKNVYLEAKYFGMHVDHIIPLQGKTVCGLHVWDNLQLLDPVENLRKGNRFAIHEES